jgi:hypothetical protein
MGPLAWFLVASVNPSAWDYAGALCAWGSFVALVSAQRRRDRVIAGLAVLLGVGLSAASRPAGGTLTLAGLALAAPLLLARIAPQVEGRKRFWAWAAGGYAVLLVMAGVAATRGLFDIQWGFNYPRVSITWSLLLSNLIGAPDYLIGAVGTMGWLTTSPGSWAVIAVVSVSSYLALSALRRGRRLVSLTVGAYVAASMVLPAIILTLSHTATGSVFQARYVWPFVVGCGFVATLGLWTTGRLSAALGGHVRWALVVAMAVGTGVALSRNIDFYANVPSSLASGAHPSGPDWVPPVLGYRGTLALGSTALLVFYLVGFLPWRNAHASASLPEAAEDTETRPAVTTPADA